MEFRISCLLLLLADFYQFVDEILFSSVYRPQPLLIKQGIRRAKELESSLVCEDLFSL